ncbi:Phytochelatin synthase-domain-containing protein [Chytriomyces sp. MP71]|nr:Phytochelatin synthase-domain-containing protein [Chytriomyces sp. MP71]
MQVSSRLWSLARHHSTDASLGSVHRASVGACPAVHLHELPAPKGTYFRRNLPPILTSFTSVQGRRLFKESLARGTAEAFLHLSGNLAHQSEPAFCGLGSLAIVLNALEIDPQRPWKGAWRWYDETMLDCCAPLDLIRTKGITFDEFACLAACNGLGVVAKRVLDPAPHGSSPHHPAGLLSTSNSADPFAPDVVILDAPAIDTESLAVNEVMDDPPITREEFIQDLKRVCSDSDGTTQMVVSFSRQTLHQTGDGHFSPVACFHEESGQVLVLDVARFKYPSYFVPIDVLYNAMKPVDKVTGKSRGYFMLSKKHTVDGSIAIDVTDSLTRRGLKGNIFKASTSTRRGNSKTQIEANLKSGPGLGPAAFNEVDSEAGQVSLAKITPVSLSKTDGLPYALNKKLLDTINLHLEAVAPTNSGPVPAGAKHTVLKDVLTNLIGDRRSPRVGADTLSSGSGVLSISFREPALDLAASKADTDPLVPAQEQARHQERIASLVSEVEALPIHAYVAKAHASVVAPTVIHGLEDAKEARLCAVLSTLLVVSLPSTIYLSLRNDEMRSFFMSSKYLVAQGPKSAVVKAEMQRIESQLTNLMTKS